MQVRIGTLHGLTWMAKDATPLIYWQSGNLLHTRESWQMDFAFDALAWF